MRRLTLIVTVIAATLLVAAPHANACVEEAPCQAIIEWAWVGGQGSGNIEIRITCYQTFGSIAGDVCGLGLSADGLVVTSVAGGAVVQAGTSTSVVGFGPFTANAALSANLGIACTASISAFLSVTTLNIAAGSPTDLLFQATVATSDESAIDAAVNGMTVATCEANVSGGIVGHLTCATPPPIPTLSEWGMIIFVVLLLGAGAFYIVRRRGADAAA